MPKLSIGLTLVLVMGGLVSAQPASACALPLHVFAAAPPGLSPAEERRYYAYQEAEIAKADAIEEALRPFNEQKALWEESKLIFTARVESVSQRKIETFWGNIVEIQDVELRPVSWLKGQGQKRNFTIGISGWSDCGPDKRWDALLGKPGDTFVVFVEKGPPSNETVSEAIKPSKIVDPELKMALSTVQ